MRSSVTARVLRSLSLRWKTDLILGTFINYVRERSDLPPQLLFAFVRFVFEPPTPPPRLRTLFFSFPATCFWERSFFLSLRKAAALGFSCLLLGLKVEGRVSSWDEVSREFSARPRRVLEDLTHFPARQKCLLRSLVFTHLFPICFETISATNVSTWGKQIWIDLCLLGTAVTTVCLYFVRFGVLWWILFVLLGFFINGCDGYTLSDSLYHHINQIRLVDGNGDLKCYRRDDESDDFFGVGVSMGLMGVIYEVFSVAFVKWQWSWQCREQCR